LNWRKKWATPIGKFSAVLSIYLRPSLFRPHFHIRISEFLNI
jgi:hypothetical protein